MANALYTRSAGADPYALDVDQFTNTLQGTIDPGPITLAGPTAAPGAPSVTLAAGSLTGSWQWCAWWITGVPVGGSGTPNVNGVTPAGTATATQTLSSQEAVLTVPASPPSTAVGCAFGRTQTGPSGTFYAIPGATVYKTAGGAWPQYIDNNPDSVLGASVPFVNTTGTPVTFGAGATVPSGQTLAMAGATISGGPTFSDEPTFAAGATGPWLQATAGGPSAPSQGAYLAWDQSGGTGETDFLNEQGGGSGGWSWRYWTGSAWQQVAFLDQNGNATFDGAGTFGGVVAIPQGSNYTFTGLTDSTGMLYNATSGDLYWIAGPNGYYWANAANNVTLAKMDNSGNFSIIGSATIPSGQSFYIGGASGNTQLSQPGTGVTVAGVAATLLAAQISGSPAQVAADTSGNLGVNGTLYAGGVSASTLKSTVGTGTAPLSVDSTTQVPNLNASYVGGLSVGNISEALTSVTPGTTAGDVLMTTFFVAGSSGYPSMQVVYVSGYENDTTTSQTIPWPQAFSYYAYAVTNSAGLSVSATTTGLTITAPDDTSVFEGMILVIGA